MRTYTTRHLILIFVLHFLVFPNVSLFEVAKNPVECLRFLAIRHFSLGT